RSRFVIFNNDRPDLLAVKRYPISTLAGMPGVVPARPKQEAFLFVADFHDDIGLDRQPHYANRLLADRRRNACKSGGGVFHEIRLPRDRITPSFAAEAVNDREKLLSLADL